MITANNEFADGVGSNARFSAPYGMTVDPAGTLYVADYYNNNVRAVNSTSGLVSAFASAYQEYPAYVDGAGTVARFNRPTGLAYGAGTVFITEPNYIRATDVATRVTTTLAGAGWPADCINGVGTNAYFNYPAGIAYFGGSVYIGDNCGWIRAVDIATRDVTTLAGGGSGDGIGTNAGIYGPSAITASSSGVLYACTGGQVRAIVIATRAVSTLAGSGANDFAEGVGVAAAFNHNQGISINEPLGVLFIADSWNGRVRLINIATATVSTLVGPGSGTYADGRGSSAAFQGLAGMAVDGAGNIYVSDVYNRLIRVIASA